MKRKFRYIANEKGFQYVGKHICLNGTFKIFQNNQYIEERFDNKFFTIIEIMKNGLMLRGDGHGDIVDTEENNSFFAESKYGNGPFLLTKNEMRRKR